VRRRRRVRRSTLPLRSQAPTSKARAASMAGGRSEGCSSATHCQEPIAVGLVTAVTVDGGVETVFVNDTLSRRARLGQDGHDARTSKLLQSSGNSVPAPHMRAHAITAWALASVGARN